MFRMIRRRIVTPLAVAAGVALIVPTVQAQSVAGPTVPPLLRRPGQIDPAVRAQSDADQKQVLSAYGRAEAFRKQGKLAEAARQYEQAVDLARRIDGPEGRNTAPLMNDLADLYQTMGRYADAEPL